jgi:hypothetical protein
VAKAHDKLFIQTNDSTVFTLFPQAYIYTSKPKYQLVGYSSAEAAPTEQPISIRGEDIANTYTVAGGKDSNRTYFILLSGKKLGFRPNTFMIIAPGDSSGLWGIGSLRQGRTERAFAGRVPTDEKTLFWFREYNSTHTGMVLKDVTLVILIKPLSDMDCIFCLQVEFTIRESNHEKRRNGVRLYNVDGRLRQYAYCRPKRIRR